MEMWPARTLLPLWRSRRRACGKEEGAKEGKKKRRRRAPRSHQPGRKLGGAASFEIVGEGVRATTDEWCVYLFLLEWGLSRARPLSWHAPLLVRDEVGGGDWSS